MDCATGAHSLPVPAAGPSKAPASPGHPLHDRSALGAFLAYLQPPIGWKLCPPLTDTEIKAHSGVITYPRHRQGSRDSNSGLLTPALPSHAANGLKTVVFQTVCSWYWEQLRLVGHSPRVKHCSEFCGISCNPPHSRKCRRREAGYIEKVTRVGSRTSRPQTTRKCIHEPRYVQHCLGD